MYGGRGCMVRLSPSLCCCIHETALKNKVIKIQKKIMAKIKNFHIRKKFSSIRNTCGKKKCMCI